MGLLLKPINHAVQHGPLRRLRISVLLLLVALAFAATLMLSGVGSAAKSKVGTLGTGAGALGGQLSGVVSVAVNQDGIGGVNAGSVYVVRGGDRIDQFGPDGTFVRGFGFNVVASGEHDMGAAPEVCQAGSSPADVCQNGTASPVAGGLSSPQGLAIDQSTGNLYVADQNNRRIDVFSAKGDFQGAWGWGVISNNTAELQFCTTATGCVTGLTGPGAGEFAQQTPTLAVDPTNGHVFVGQVTNNRVDEFAPTTSDAGVVTGVSFVHAFGWGVQTGASQLERCTTATGCLAGLAGAGLGQFGPKVAGSGLQSLAVDSTGSIYALNRSVGNGAGACNATSPCRIQKFNNSGTSVTEFAALADPTDPANLKFTSGVPKAFRLAVDPTNDHVLVAQVITAGQVVVKEFTSTGTLVETSPSASTFASTSPLGLALDPARDRMYLVASGVDVYILEEAPAPEVEIRPVTNAGFSTARFNGSVTPPSGGYDTTYHFEYSTDGVTWHRQPASEVDVGSDHVPVAVSQDVADLEPGTTYSVRLVATTGTQAFSETTSFTSLTTPAAAPSISGTVATPVGSTNATLTGFVNPNNQPTTYHVEWGLTAEYGHQAPEFEAFTGSGGKPVRVGASIAGLAPNKTYHFRIVADNASGTTTGPDQKFTTLGVNGLPNHRAYELVSPADKGPGGYVGTIPLFNTNVNFQASSDGNRFAYALAYGVPDAKAGGPVVYLASRSADNWASTELSAPALIPPYQPTAWNATSQTLYYSEDLTCGFLQSGEPLTPDAPQAVIDAGGSNLYRRNTDGSYTLISNETPTNAVLAGNNYVIVGATSDCSTVVFETTFQYPGIDASGLYAWSAGKIRSVGVLPDGTAASDPRAGYQVSSIRTTGSVWNAVSEDGSRIFFSATSNEGADAGKLAVFVREGGSKTVDVSQSETAVVNQGTHYQLASKSGHKVLFLANYGLTASSSAGPTTANCSNDVAPQACDLYQATYDTATDDWKLTNLSVDTNAADTDGATVAGVLAASDDASHVYFAAAGQLVPGKGKTYAQNISDASYNVYLSDAGTLTFVGLLNQADLFDDPSGALITNSSGKFATWRSQVTPDGRRLLFSSTANVTGYDSGGVAEAYLYSADSESTVCVSCRPDGRPSVGTTTGSVFSLTAPLPGGSGAGSATNPYHPPLALSDDGQRVFFTMPDPLASGAVGGQSNVYQWQEGQVALLATGDDVTLWGASRTGDNVFISTSQRLLPQDTDFSVDLYDVRVGGGFPVPVKPATPCDPLAEGSCQGPLVTPPGIASLGSTTLVGGGNVPPPPATPPAPKMPRLKVTKPKTAHGTSTRIKVKVPEQGKIRTSGSGLLRSSRTAKRAGGTYRVMVRLSKRARRMLQRNGRVRVRVTVRFTPKHGKQQRERVHMTFKAKRSKGTRRSVAASRGITVSVDAHGKVR